GAAMSRSHVYALSAANLSRSATARRWSGLRVGRDEDDLRRHELPGKDHRVGAVERLLETQRELARGRVDRAAVVEAHRASARDDRDLAPPPLDHDALVLRARRPARVVDLVESPGQES